MDRIGPRIAVLRLVALAAIAAAASPGANFPIRAAKWLDPSQRVTALSSQPDECAAIPGDHQQRQLFEIGRAAFRAPLLLGGQAARSGLSCASCHNNGRSNPAFRFPGLSGEPGTADVTSSLMSSHRGNGVFDPRLIPDLAVPVKISRARGDPALESFIHGLIVEEFDGAEPSRLILRGLGEYVRAIGRPGCDLARREAIQLEAMVQDVSRAVAASRHAWTEGDPASARLLVSSARSGLGLLYERYAGPDLRRDQAAIRSADQALLAIEQQMDSGQASVLAQIARWQARVPNWSGVLKRDQRRSLLEPTRLRQHLQP